MPIPYLYGVELFAFNLLELMLVLDLDFDLEDLDFLVFFEESLEEDVALDVELLCRFFFNFFAFASSNFFLLAADGILYITIKICMAK